MTDNVVALPERFRHEQPGYFLLADLPQRPSIAEHSLSTGWWELDQIFKIYEGQLTIVTGLAGSGKSTLLLNLVANIFEQHDIRSFLYVPENEAHLRDKMRGIWGDRPDFDNLAFNCFVQSAVPDQWDQRPRTLLWVLEKARLAIDEDECGLILIDPWNELERAKPKDQLLSDYIGECLMLTKQFCRTQSCMVIIVAHPTKAGVEQGKTPGLADIEGSMNWFNKCDNGLIVVREADKNSTKVISAKVREHGAGKRGAAWFHVDEATGLFRPQHGAVTT